MLSGIGSTIAQGMAFGTGSAVAHRKFYLIRFNFIRSHFRLVSECDDHDNAANENVHHLPPSPLRTIYLNFQRRTGAVGAVAGSFGGGGGGGDAANDQAVAAQQQDQLSNNGMQQAATGPCAQDKQMFYECLQMNRGDQQACQFLYDQLKQCQMNEPQFG